MSTNKVFANMSESELIAWYTQYGCKRQCGFYNIRKIRNKARTEILARGINVPQQEEWRFLVLKSH